MVYPNCRARERCSSVRIVRMLRFWLLVIVPDRRFGLAVLLRFLRLLFLLLLFLLLPLLQLLLSTLLL